MPNTKYEQILQDAVDFFGDDVLPKKLKDGTVLNPSDEEYFDAAPNYILPEETAAFSFKAEGTPCPHCGDCSGKAIFVDVTGKVLLELEVNE